MEKKQFKIKEFIKEHKKGIIIGAIGVVGLGVTIAGIVLGNKSGDSAGDGFTLFKSNDIQVEDWDVGNLTDCWKDKTHINAIVEGLTVGDAGKLGEELLKIDGVTLDTELDVILGMPNSNQN